MLELVLLYSLFFAFLSAAGWSFLRVWLQEYHARVIFFVYLGFYQK